MLFKLLTKIFGNKNDRIIRRMRIIVNNINNMEFIFNKFSNNDLSYKTAEFRNRIKNGELIDNMFPEIFSVICEVNKRINNICYFDIQLIGGILLNNSCIIEMCTGEGKTLTATFPAYINALFCKGVHIITVNDYLAKRDSDYNRLLFEFLGLTVGVNLQNLPIWAKKLIYKADITYGTNNEFVFDYLRDNMVTNIKECVQRNLYYALLDEVDSILIDEACTPLVISGFSEDISYLYIKINKIIKNLCFKKKNNIKNFLDICHFLIDEKNRQINLTELGFILIEKLFIKFKLLKKGEFLYLPNNIILIHHVIISLHARFFLFLNIDYIIKNNEILIIDEYTGRVIPGRRWSNGLHQAVEAKENLNVQNENEIFASITFQNYFRLYKKIAGMTGTANTESLEFKLIYKLDTILLPTNRPMIRKDYTDLVYMTEKEKINAIIFDINSCIKKRQPVLIGTISIEKSELISKELNKLNISHKVLNAKFHSLEADIIAQAGKPGSVTISTNMAGRGTDIILGGNWKTDLLKFKYLKKNDINNIKIIWKKRRDIVISAGGLHVIGSERHESRRIDNQLRGRSGRQGDIGSSRFYLSMEDNLMRIFLSDYFLKILNSFVVKKNEPIEHPWIDKAIIKAQQKVVNRNFNIRKQLLEYDDILNDQRYIVYKQRNKLLKLENISNFIKIMRKDLLKNIINIYIPFKFLNKNNDILGLSKYLKINLNFKVSLIKFIENKLILDKNILYISILNYLLEQYHIKKIIYGIKFIRNAEKFIVLKIIDLLWKKHLLTMNYLRKSIHLRCYAQRDPKQEYKRESFMMFEVMLDLLKYEVVSKLSNLETTSLEDINFY